MSNKKDTIEGFMKWISVKAGLPNYDWRTKYTVIELGDCLTIAYFKNNTWHNITGSYEREMHVTHWIRLPTLPKE